MLSGPRYRLAMKTSLEFITGSRYDSLLLSLQDEAMELGINPYLLADMLVTAVRGILVPWHRVEGQDSQEDEEEVG